MNGEIVYRSGDSARATARPLSQAASCGRSGQLPAPALRSDMARTQQQRREETVARLLDASIATIVEVGYARASATVITKRADASVGALFRHFETMGDFMAATAYEVLRRQLESFTKQVAEIPADGPALEGPGDPARHHRQPDERGDVRTVTAARTDEKLRATLQHARSPSTPA